jgi:cell division protein FtsB
LSKVKASEDAAARRRPARALLLGAAGFFVLLVSAAGWKSYRDLETARQREAMLATRIVETQARVDELRRKVARLRDDPVALERMAREELGLVKPGDVVVVYPEPPAPPATKAAPPGPPS